MYKFNNSMMEYTFPLGINGLDAALDTHKHLFMRFVLKLRTAEKIGTYNYISTKTKVTRSSILEKCDGTIKLVVSMAELLKFDILDGLLDSHSRLHMNTTTVYKDVTGADKDTRDITVQLATPLTFVLRIDQIALSATGYNRYEIKVVTVFTMYFISNVKKDSIKAGRGFTQYADGSINPAEDLLRICPLHRIAGVYGCVARFEVQSGLYYIDSTSILSVASDPQLCKMASETWAQRQKSASLAFQDSIATHASIARENFAINPSSRKAFVVAQDVPWSEAEFRNDKSLTYLRYPQVARTPRYAPVLKTASVCVKHFFLCSPII